MDRIVNKAIKDIKRGGDGYVSFGDMKVAEVFNTPTGYSFVITKNGETYGQSNHNKIDINGSNNIISF